MNVYESCRTRSLPPALGLTLSLSCSLLLPLSPLLSRSPHPLSSCSYHTASLHTARVLLKFIAACVCTYTIPGIASMCKRTRQSYMCTCICVCVCTVRSGVATDSTSSQPSVVNVLSRRVVLSIDTQLYNLIRATGDARLPGIVSKILVVRRAVSTG